MLYNIKKLKIGIFVPTYNRPDLIRYCLLQLAAQTKKPDVVAVHQNGNPKSYKTIIEDLDWPFNIKWIHTKHKIREHEWYRIPLNYLIDEGCDLFFWVDHDDFYSKDHIKTAFYELKKYDFRISKGSNFIAIDTSLNKFKICKTNQFRGHIPGGMSASIAFNKNFAIELEKKLLEDKNQRHSDAVLAKEVMPKFKCLISKNKTTTYVCHPGSVTSNSWVNRWVNGTKKF